MIMEKYFVVHRYRQGIDEQYVREFIRDEDDIKYHTTVESASTELHNGFYDDSDYGVFSINYKGEIKRYDHNNEVF